MSFQRIEIVIQLNNYMIVHTLGDRLCLEGSAYWNDILYNEGKIVIYHIKKKTKKRYFPNQRRNEPVQIFFLDYEYDFKNIYRY